MLIHRHILTAGIALIVLIAAAGSSAQERGTPDVGRFKGAEVERVRIVGLDGDLEPELKKGLALAQKSGILNTGHPLLYEGVLEEDLARCRLFLARRGFPYSLVDASVFPRGDDGVELRIDVRPGPRVTLAAVAVNGAPDTVEERVPKLSLPEPGQPLLDAGVQGARDRLRAEAREHGYARAEVEFNVDWRDSTSVALTYDVAPGDYYRFGDKFVEGADDDLVGLVRRSLETERGRTFSPAAIRRSRDNLRLLDLFRQVRVDYREAAPGTLDVVARLEQRDPMRIETGIGLWTDDLLRVRAEWLHRNLFKRGRGFSVGAAASRFNQTGRLSTWWPGVFVARTRVGTSLRFERDNEENYEAISAGVDFFATYDYSLVTSLRADLDITNVWFDGSSPDPDAFVEGDGLLTVVKLNWTRNSSDNPLNPTKGTSSSITVAATPPGDVSESHFTSAEAVGAVYMPLFGTVVAARLEGGVAKPFGDSVDLLPTRRFFSGGSNSMRGFKRRRLGPLDSNEDPLGGEAKLEAAVELRFPILGPLGGAMFVDTGKVWQGFGDVEIDEMEVAPGAGLRFSTPIGPIRFDAGYRASDVESDEPRWVYHIAIGQAF